MIPDRYQCGTRGVPDEDRGRGVQAAFFTSANTFTTPGLGGAPRSSAADSLAIGGPASLNLSDGLW